MHLYERLSDVVARDVLVMMMPASGVLLIKSASRFHNLIGVS